MTAVSLSLLGEVVTGSTPPAANPEWFASSGIPFVTPSDIQDGVRFVHTDRFLSAEGAKALGRRVLPADAVCFVCIGSTIGRMCTTTEPSVTNQQINSLVVNYAVADPTFVYYAIFQRAAELKAIAGGSATPILNKSAFSAVTIDVLPVEAQRAIGALLRALDDKIESNRRAIELTQALSRWTYVGWRAMHPDTHDTTFGKFADVFGGATPKTSEPGHWDGDIAWATPTDITALTAPYLFGTARMVTKAGLASTSATLHPAGTIFMTSRATIGSFAVAHVPAATNQGFIAVRPRKPEHRWFLFAEMRARVPEMLDRANGSTFMELSRGNFKLMPLGVPDEAAITELDSDLAPLHTKAAQLDRESSRLAKLRDTLLPELLSGRIRVPEAHETVADTAASV